MDIKKIIILIIVGLLPLSCAKKQEPIIATQEPLEDIQEPVQIPQEAGSLWNQNNNSMFSDRKARTVGDIVTVLISESSSASKEASTESGRTTSMKASISNFFGLENSEDLVDDNSNIDLANLINTSFTNDFKGSGATSREESLTASLTTQVVGQYPNGQLKIRGGKEVMVNNEVQIIYLTGIIRDVDITAANTVDSSKILNARISYTGNGAVSDKQKPGWMVRILDNVWPF